MTCLTTPPIGETPVKPACFPLTALLPDLQTHTELDLKTLAYHLQQSDATAADGYHHAAVNEARSFLEALVVNIVQAVRREITNGDAEPNGGHGLQNGAAFRTYRRQLHEAGFIDSAENDLLQYVYSVASAKGSHAGVTDELWTRLARRIIFATGQYVAQRYGAWKEAGCPIASTPPQRAATRVSFWHRWRAWRANGRK